MLMGMWTNADARGNSVALFFHTPTDAQLGVRQSWRETVNAAYTYRVEGNQLFLAANGAELPPQYLRFINPNKLQIKRWMGDPSLNVTFKRAKQ